MRPPRGTARSPRSGRPSAALRLVLPLFLGAAAGCVRRAPPADLSADPAELLAQVERTQAAVERVRGEARVKVESKDGSGTITQLVSAQRPDRLRLDALDFFGNPAAALVADGGRFALLDLRAGVFYRGAATPENLARLVPLPISAGELVQILCGAAPIARGRAAAVDAGDGVLRLTVEGDDRMQRLDVGEGAAVQGSVVSLRDGAPAAAPAYDLAFGRFEPLGGRPFPGEVKLTAKAVNVKLRLTWKEIEVNGVLPEGTFTLTPPPGVRIVDLDGDLDLDPHGDGEK
jgi:outer membrane lipoprotein-sorting protein